MHNIFKISVIAAPVVALIIGSSTGTVRAETNNTKLFLLKTSRSVAPLNGNAESIAWMHLKKNASQFGISQTTELNLVRTQESLLGKHYTFQQRFNGYDIESAQLVVSLDNNNQIFKIFNNLHALTQGDASKIKNRGKEKVTIDSAFDKAWNELRVHGSLMAAPEAKTIYVVEGSDIRLVTKTLVAVEAPFGYWEHTIDAISGEIVKTRRTEISRRKLSSVEKQFKKYKGGILDRKTEVERFAKASTAKVSAAKKGGGGKPGGGGGTPADGTATVFNPDPVTTLTNSSLSDGSSASAFSGAYTTEILKDINLDSKGVYSLTGPWITIAQFESPRTLPSTTTSGNWTAERGNNAFNDAVTYFHIDQNQRYIQSLGFSGAKGIQEDSIETDTDGLQGSDNSHYIPSSNRMSFGHGCVDDNEDAFVILHEYGHAIQHSIAGNNWSGGDTGAMGEGFGDYWAGSYRYSTPNGPSFNPAWAFPWDGHNACWPGRDMDVTSATYDPNISYGAHQGMGGFVSDELWSTPLFQSLITLVNQGIARDEVDQIILEAHFGITSGASMRDMANSIVATAQALYPNGPHAQVFTQKFQAQNILP